MREEKDVRKPGRNRKWLRRLLGLFLVAGLLALLYFPEFTEFYSEGTEYCDGQRILKLHFGEEKDRRLYSILWKTFFPPSTDAYTTQIHWKSLSALRVTVTEEEPYCVISDGNVSLAVTEEGTVLGEVTENEDLFLCSGIAVVEYQPFEILENAAAKDALSVLRMAERYEIPTKRLELREEGFYLILSDPDTVAVSLGDASGLEGKMNVLSSQLPSLEGLTGTMHLEDAEEESGSGYRFTVE